MTPDANLKEALRLASRVEGNDENTAEAQRLAELVKALDRWLRNGGKLPKAWVR